MKILMLAAGFDIGGAETHILDLSRALIKKGVSVTLISEGGAYINRAEQIGIRCILAPTKRETPTSFMECREIILGELKRTHYDAVHAHTRYVAALAHLFTKRLRTPLVVTAHLCFSLGLKGYLSRWGDATLAVSEDIRDYLVKDCGVDKAQIILTKNGIDGEIFKKCPQNSKRIIHLSRLDRGRSLTAKLLADAAVKILHRHPDYEILIGGDGDDFGDVKERVREANAALGFDGVKLLGKLTDVAAALSLGQIFVGASRAALEAATVGLAVVISGDEGYGGVLCEESFDGLAKSNFCARGLKMATKELITRDVLELIENENYRKTQHAYLPFRTRRDFSSESMANDALAAYRLAKRRKKLSAALVGYYGYGNLGDEETLKILKDMLAEKDISVAFPPDANEVSGVISRSIKLARGIRSCKLVIFGGGNLIQNETSRRSLIYYCEAIKFAARHGKPVLMFSSGIGEIRGRLWRRYALNALSRCEFLGLRTSHDILETSSLNSLSEKRKTRDGVRMPDLCFSFMPSDIKKENFLVFIPEKDGEVTAEQISEICKKCALLPKIVVIFQKADTKRAQELAEALNAPLHFVKDRQSATALIGSAKMAISERLHGAIFALLSKTPVFLDTRKEKCEALVRELELTTRRADCNCPIFPIAMTYNSKKLLSKISSSDFELCLSSLRRELFAAIENIL